jgi:hypothetical protein
MSTYWTTANEFLDPPSDWDVVAAERRWNTCPRGKAKDMPACMVCLTKIKREENSRDMDVRSIPNKMLLTPEAYHPAHELHEGLLLDLAVVHEKDGNFRSHICNNCLQDLDDAIPPVLSLANGSWIGLVPPVL